MKLFGIFCRARKWPADYKLAFEICLAKAKKEIIDDVIEGRIPSTVGCFSEVHEYVDGNEYGWGFHHPMNLQDDVIRKFCGQIQQSLDDWIISGGLRENLIRQETDKARKTIESCGRAIFMDVEISLVRSSGLYSAGVNWYESIENAIRAVLDHSIYEE